MFKKESKTTCIPTPQQPHRRHDRYRRGMFDLTNKYTEQNEKIIALLTEIRDRLPRK